MTMRRQVPGTAMAAATVLLLSACSSDDAQPAGADTDAATSVPAPSWFEPEQRESSVGLAWEEVDGADHYEVHFDGERRYDVSTDRCEEAACVVGLRRNMLLDLESAEVTVRTVIDGERSEDSPAATIVRPDPPEREDPPPGAVVARQGPDPALAPEFELVEPEPGESLDELIERLEGKYADDDEVVGIAPNERVDPLGAGDDSLTGSDRAPPGSDDDGAWAAHDLGLPDLSVTATGEGVTIALIDMGDIDRSHPELRDAGPVQGIADDGPSDGASETSEHVTAVAGTILGTDAVPGVAPAAEVLFYDVDVETATDTAVSRAIVQAVRDGADVINLSVSSLSREHPPMQAAINFARSNDVLVIAGAGNHAAQGCDTWEGREHGEPTMPAAADGVLRVGASARDGQRWRCSVPADDTVLAPGQGISVLDVGRRAWWIIGPWRYTTDLGTGTSFAAPMVSGVAALLRELDPTLTHDRVEVALRATLTEQGVIDPQLATALHDPDAPALSIGVHERQSASRSAFYYSLTAVTDGERLVGTGQLYTALRSVVPDQTFTCRDAPRAHFRIDQTITVSGQLVEVGGHTSARIEFAPSEPQVTNFPSCRDEDYRADWFADAERATAAIGASSLETRIGHSTREDGVAVGVSEGRCEPIKPTTTGGCDHPSAQETRAQMLADPDRPVPDQDRPR